MEIKEVVEDISNKSIEELGRETIELYRELKDFFEDESSYELYAFYGTLLGIVREKDPIFNDGNFDCAYLSKDNKEDKVIAEFKAISKSLIKKGYCLKVLNSHIQVSREESGANINIYRSWFDESSKFRLSFDYIGKEIINDANKLAMQTSIILEEQVLIPKAYEEILNQIYGEGWNVSDFEIKGKSISGKGNFMNDNDMNEIYWEQYYLNSKLQKPSTFCYFINDFITEKYLVLDIGCGSARDSFEFAQQGHDVIGLDRSEQAIMFANSLIKEEKYENINFQIVDISDETLMSKLFKKSKEQAKQKQKNIIYYSRFFLHSIDGDSQKQLLKAMSNYINSGDLFIAEFRTKEDEIRQKVYSNHYRRFLDEQELLNQLKEICNMDKLLLFQKGTGFSIYKDEDPFLARIIVGRD